MGTSCNAGGCGCSSTVEQNPPAAPGAGAGRKRVELVFLYLDLDVCSPCRSTEKNIEEALSQVSGVLDAAGAEVSLRKVHVQSFEQAVELGFLTSPTVRVGGRDLQLDFQENHCATCSEVSGTRTDCRVWLYRGRQYSAPPKEMIVEAVLREVYGGAPAGPAKVVRPEAALENLARFFESKRRKELSGAA
jgi:hypothetical protein